MVKSVRLACLMCAASVYPEPGSNSLILVSIFTLSSYINQVCFSSFEFLFFGSILLPLVVFSFWIYYLLFNVLFRSGWNVLYYITFHILCQHFFWIFLKYFSKCFWGKNKISNLLLYLFSWCLLITNSLHISMCFSLLLLGL